MINQLDVALERMAQAFPWETVQIWVKREPAGELTFTTYLEPCRAKGFECVFGHGETPNQAVDDLIKQAGDRDPEKLRLKVIRELEEQLAQIKAAQFGLPPYRPNRQLCETNPELSNYRQTRRETVDVETVKEQVPF